MSLAEVQSAIAALVCESGAIDAFAQDRAGWTRTQGVSRTSAPLVTALSIEELRRFRAIRSRDRAYFIESLFPLTLRRTSRGAVDVYFERDPYGDSDTLVEAARFIASPIVAEDPGAFALGRFELACASLAVAPDFEAARVAAPGDHDRLALVPGLAHVEASVNLARLIDDPSGPAVVRAGGMLLRKAAGGIEHTWIEPEVASVFTAIAGGATRREIAREGGPLALKLLDQLILEGVVTAAKR